MPVMRFAWWMADGRCAMGESTGGQAPSGDDTQVAQVLATEGAWDSSCSPPSPIGHPPSGLFRPRPHLQELLPAAPYQLVRLQPPEVLEVPDQGLLECRRCRLVVGMGSSHGLGDDLVDHLEVRQLGRRYAERGGRALPHFHAL